MTNILKIRDMFQKEFPFTPQFLWMFISFSSIPLLVASIVTHALYFKGNQIKGKMRCDQKENKRVVSVMQKSFVTSVLALASLVFQLA